MRYKKKGRKIKKPNKTEFDWLYYDCDRTAEELAEKYQVSPGTIYNWAVEFRKEEKN